MAARTRHNVTGNLYEVFVYLRIPNKQSYVEHKLTSRTIIQLPESSQIPAFVAALQQSTLHQFLCTVCRSSRWWKH